MFAAAIEDGSARRPSRTRLRTFYATERAATPTVAGALYAAAPMRPEQFPDAVLGAVDGVDALPVDVLSRCELVWVADILARDLVTELTESPHGHEMLQPTGPGTYTMGWQEATEPARWQRYPGW